MLDIEQVGALYVLLDDLRTHVLFARAIKQLDLFVEAEYSDASCIITWLADPNVVFTIDRSVLGVNLQELSVYFAYLVHDVEVGDLPTTDVREVKVLFFEL